MADTTIERDALDPAARAALVAAEQEHGERRVALIMTEEGPVVIKRPHRNNVYKLLDAERITTSAQLALVKSCLVHPSAEAFDKILDEQPAALVHIAGAALTLAGSGAKALAGK